MRGFWEHNVPVQICRLINVFLMAIPFAFVWYMFYTQKAEVQYYTKGNWAIIAIFIVFYFIFGRVYDAFVISIHKISEMVLSQVLALIASNVVMYLLFWVISRYIPNPLPLMIAFGMQIVISIIWCAISSKWYYKKFKPYKTAIVYDVREGMDKLVKEYGLEKKYEILFSVGVKECLENLSMLDECEAVFMSGVHSHDRNIILKYCVYNSINTYIIPRVGDVLMSGAQKIHMFHLPILKVGRYNPEPLYLMIKRFFDIVLTCIALVPASPVMLVTAIAIKSYDHGPVLYKQKRLTKDGKEFYVMKFRSMRVDAEKDGVARLSSGENDPRITPIGRKIRACRIDELPQLFNILKGDMAIVGPRPERPEIAEKYCKEMTEFKLRLQAKAGLTGYAQVYGKYNSTPYDKLQMDLMYISNPSFWEDVKICCATVKILFSKESTEGVDVNQTTALESTEGDSVNQTALESDEKVKENE